MAIAVFILFHSSMCLYLSHYQYSTQFHLMAYNLKLKIQLCNAKNIYKNAHDFVSPVRLEIQSQKKPCKFVLEIRDYFKSQIAWVMHISLFILKSISRASIAFSKITTSQFSIAIRMCCNPILNKHID